MLRRADTRHLPPTNPRIRLSRSLPLRPAPQSGGESACACGLWLDTDGDCGSAYASLRCNRVSACCAAPTPDWLFTASAQCSVKPVPQRLCRASGTLSAVNRLVLHSHSLQAQCFAAGASRVVGGVSLPEVLHYARRTPSASPPFEHSPTSPYHEITTSGLAVISSAIVGKPTILKSGSQSAPRKSLLRSRFLVTHWRFYRTSPCIFRSAQGRFRGFLRRAVGGSSQTVSGQSPEPQKSLIFSDFL